MEQRDTFPLGSSRELRLAFKEQCNTADTNYGFAQTFVSEFKKPKVEQASPTDLVFDQMLQNYFNNGSSQPSTKPKSHIALAEVPKNMKMNLPQTKKSSKTEMTQTSIIDQPATLDQQQISVFAQQASSKPETLELA